MRTLIYGGGAVGLGIASCLLQASTEVTILARRDTFDLLRRKGLTRTGIFGDAFAGPGSFDAIQSLHHAGDAPFDYVLVCTKSFDTGHAARDLHEHGRLDGERSPIVLFQNGWGNAEVFTRFFPRDVVYNARVITGFIRPERNHVDVTVHADAIHVGSLYTQDTTEIAPLCEAIAQGGIPCEPVPEIEKDLWAKMLFNCPLNPLGAMFGATYGALGESEHARHIMGKIIHEVFEVMAAAGYSTHWKDAREYELEFYDNQVRLTARHHSSTLQDLRAGKRTEIDALNGAIVALAREHGIDAPANEVVYRATKFLENPPRLE
jgi:2-dehydropantoate 2-reductase